MYAQPRTPACRRLYCTGVATFGRAMVGPTPVCTTRWLDHPGLKAATALYSDDGPFTQNPNHMHNALRDTVQTCDGVDGVDGVDRSCSTGGLVSRRLH